MCARHGVLIRIPNSKQCTICPFLPTLQRVEIRTLILSRLPGATGWYHCSLKLKATNDSPRVLCLALMSQKFTALNQSSNPFILYEIRKISKIRRAKQHFRVWQTSFLHGMEYPLGPSTPTSGHFIPSLHHRVEIVLTSRNPSLIPLQPQTESEK